MDMNDRAPRDILVNAGSKREGARRRKGFVVVISGNMMLMPGLPKVPRAVDVNVDVAGEIVGI